MVLLVLVSSALQACLICLLNSNTDSAQDAGHVMLGCFHRQARVFMYCTRFSSWACAWVVYGLT